MIIFDLDDTILSINSHFVFSNSLFEKRRLVATIYRLLVWGIIGKTIGYLAKNDSRRVISFFLYRLYSEEQLRSHSRTVFSTLDGITNKKVFELFEQLKHKDDVIVITATPNFIADQFSNLLGVPVFGSKFDGKKLTLDLLNNKYDYINKKFGKIRLIVSDSTKDLECLSDSKIFVHRGEIFKDQRAQELF